jgi:hypothetical protein
MEIICKIREATSVSSFELSAHIPVKPDVENLLKQMERIQKIPADIN